MNQLNVQGACAELESEIARLRKEVAYYAQLEDQNTNMTNLYVASCQLYGTLDRATVLGAIQEIVINLVGSEQFAIIERDGAGDFNVLASLGLDDPQELHQRDAQIGRVVETGQAYIRGADAGGDGELTACIPLLIDGTVGGYIAVFRLLAHKQRLESLDYDLFDLLTMHAATALLCASLKESARAAEGLSA